MKEKRKKVQKDKLIDPMALIQVFGPTKKVYREIGRLTGPLRITGLRPTLKGFKFRKARISKTHKIPTLKFIKETIEKLAEKRKKEKKNIKNKSKMKRRKNDN